MLLMLLLLQLYLFPVMQLKKFLKLEKKLLQKKKKLLLLKLE